MSLKEVLEYRMKEKDHKKLDENKIIEWKCMACKERFITRHPNYCPFCGTDYNKKIMGLFPERDIIDDEE
jgi:rubrerythrin